MPSPREYLEYALRVAGHLTGRRYPTLERELREKLSPEAQLELHRMLRDLEDEVQRAKRIKAQDIMTTLARGGRLP